MKVMVVGLGSMGKRRIRLMKQYDDTMEIIGVDSQQKRREEVREQFSMTSYESLADAIATEKPDCAFVCTSPLSHRSIIVQLLSAGLHVFTEINLVDDGYEEYKQLKKEDQVLFLSSTFLYRKDIQYMISKVDGQKVNYIYHSGQYLPDWHPWENFKDFFVNEKRTNGCREILTIEMPWIVKCFGDVVDVKVEKDTLSELPLDYPDNYMITLVHENGTKGVFVVDVVSRKAMRRLEIFNEKIHLFWDGTPKSLTKYDMEEKQLLEVSTYEDIQKDNRYCENIIENAYMDEIAAFFDEVQTHSGEKVLHDFDTDQRILKLIDRIEE